MKKVFLISCLFLISLNLFAGIRISTKDIKAGTHYSIDSSVNIRKNPSLSAEKLGKVNFGDKIEVLEKTEVYFESEGIYDCFYKINCSLGIGYMFGGYISDNAEDSLGNGSNLTYFDKLYDYEIKIPKRISEKSFFKFAEKSNFIGQHYVKYSKEDHSYLPGNNEGYYIYIDFAGESPSIEELTENGRLLANEKEDPLIFNFSKASLFAISKSKSTSIKKDLVYEKISDLKILKDQFANTTFISYKMLEASEPHYVEGREFVTLQDGEFKIKRRCANYARDGIYSAQNAFIFPDDKEGEKNTIRIIGKYLQGNEVTGEYDEKIYWNGKDFAERK
ncbi:MAG: SH3 domain-containing protein [Treponema sp.]|nr:SH3 domain-containing protein [Treponema sp.]